MQIRISRGNIYMLKCETASRLFDLCRNARTCGFDILCIARTHPDILKHDFGIEEEGENIIWVSQMVGTRSINPQNLTILYDKIGKFISNSKNALVFLEGIEYLIMQNDFQKILRFLNQLYEIVAINKGIVIFQIDPRAFSAREIALMEKCAVSLERDDMVLLK
ncbi:MAG: DUF835 domain-containing protein [Methanomassiliicoccales archaeon]